MEIGDEAVDHPELEPGGDEQIGLGGACDRGAVGCGRGLEAAHRGRSDRDDAAAAPARFPDRGRSRLRNRVALAVHAMLREILHAHRLECPRAHVQRHVGELDAAFGKRREQRLVEVQARCRGRDGAGGARVYGLVAPLVLRLGRVGNIRRERNAAVALEQLEDRPVLGKAQVVELVRAAEHAHVQSTREAQRAPGFCRPARMDLRERFALRKHALDQHFDVSAGLLFPEEARLDHLRVVEYQQVAGREQLRQLGKGAVRERRRADAKQAAARARFARMLRDQLGGQLVIEFVDGKIRGRAAIMHAQSQGIQPGWRNW